MSGFFINSDISQAHTLPSEFYTQPRYFEASREKIFSSSWQPCGHAHQLKEPGACIPFVFLENFLDEPLMLSRDREGALHCLSNVCTHRGNILVTGPCNCAHIRCRYHGRIFGLDGSFVSMPEFREVKDFPSASDNLPQLGLHQWGDLLFTSLRGKECRVFDEMKKRISWMPFDEFTYRPGLSREFVLDAHWALYCENYLEGFHIPFVHATLNAVIDYGSYTTELFENGCLQLAEGKNKEDCFEIPSGAADEGKNIAAYYYWIFPNLMFNFYPWGLSLNIVEPISPERTRVRFLTYVWKEELFGKGAGSSLDKVELEDEEIVQRVQKGVRSRFYHTGRYSVTREQGTHHFHRLIAEFMN
jgi:choline monooxygenase